MWPRHIRKTIRCGLTIICVVRLSNLLCSQNNKSLVELDLEDNTLSDSVPCARLLADALKGNTNLTKLVITRSLDSTSAHGLVEKLNETCPALQVVIK